jgi:cell fate (sporulation/competence/biofilm development) regulator YlbF (YheA/YmcA/DUF963 family)
MLPANSIIVEKTRSLCQTILDSPEFQPIRQSIHAFVSHDQAQKLYKQLSEKRDRLQKKQEEGVNLTDAELSDFEKDRKAFLDNPVAMGFIQAQEEMHNIKKLVTQYVSRTMETGSVPSPDEIQTGSCGSGCGCH